VVHTKLIRNRQYSNRTASSSLLANRQRGGAFPRSAIWTPCVGLIKPRVGVKIVMRPLRNDLILGCEVQSEIRSDDSLEVREVCQVVGSFTLIGRTARFPYGYGERNDSYRLLIADVWGGY
jgi:hypothetical protein